MKLLPKGFTGSFKGIAGEFIEGIREGMGPGPGKPVGSPTRAPKRRVKRIVRDYPRRRV